VRDLGEVVTARFQKCDILVNNAGINHPIAFSELTLVEWRATMAINVESMFLTCKAFADGMVARGYGRIINIASDSLGLPIPGFSHYMASKGAVVGLTRGLANDLGSSGVTVNCIAPGLTRTPRTDTLPQSVFEAHRQNQAIKREAVPEDLVGALLFLASTTSSFMTGQTLIVNGGQLKAL
jgi:NAD(P)-dependent dehydrogenase (short-subunit alcohol dehydrogenase family)